MFSKEQKRYDRELQQWIDKLNEESERKSNERYERVADQAGGIITEDDAMILGSLRAIDAIINNTEAFIRYEYEQNPDPIQWSKSVVIALTNRIEKKRPQLLDPGLNHKKQIIQYEIGRLESLRNQFELFRDNPDYEMNNSIDLIPTPTGNKMLEPSEIKQDNELKLSVKQIALQHLFDGPKITKTNAQRTAESYNYTSGQYLLEQYEAYETPTRRTEHPGTPRLLTEKIKLFESVEPLLSEQSKKAIGDEIRILKDKR